MRERRKDTGSCELAPNGRCGYGETRYKNYGFVRGTFTYCRHPKMKYIILTRTECPVNGYKEHTTGKE